MIMVVRWVRLVGLFSRLFWYVNLSELCVVMCYLVWWL